MICWAMIFSSGLFPKAVLSDMDGLLLDTERLSKASFDKVAGDFKLANVEAIFPELIGLNPAGHKAMFESLLPNHIDAHEFDESWKADFFNRLADGVPLKAGARELLDYFKKHKIPVAVVTSSLRSKAKNLLTRSGLINTIDVLIGGDDVAQGKPHPDIYIKAAQQLGVEPQACLALEDSNNGVRAAYHAGAVVVQVPDLAEPAEDTRPMTHGVIRCLDDLYTLFAWP